jgi:hypothetical protein
MILAHIKDYTYLHSGPLLAEAIIKSIVAGVPGIERFLESRLVESGYTIPKNQKPITESIMNDY